MSSDPCSTEQLQAVDDAFDVLVSVASLSRNPPPSTPASAYPVLFSLPVVRHVDRREAGEVVEGGQESQYVRVSQCHMTKPKYTLARLTEKS